MKNVFLILAAFIMLTKPLWPVVDYVINYDYIVNTLCENKDKPELQCNGKCHLGKELAKEAGDETKNPFGGKSSQTEIPQVLISEKVSQFSFKPETEASNTHKSEYTPAFHISPYSSKILHPPRLV